MKSLNETCVLITGASRGIGGAIARRFAREGQKIVILYLHSHEEANNTARECMNLGASDVLTVSCDLRQPEMLLRLQEKLLAHHMIPDILVNNAGLSHYGLLQDVTLADWDNMVNVNLRGMFLCTQLFMPHMIRQRYGRIINVSSIWGISGAANEVLYSTTKGGVNAFTKALAKELAPSGVTVNAVAPGAVDTLMMQHLDAQEKTALAEEIPAGRFAEPREIASLVYFLSLPESSYITGQIISPNGGWLT